MPELPEVETSLRGIAPHLVGRRIARLEVRDYRLRWPIPADTAECLAGQTIIALRRRGKYLLFDLEEGVLLLHLGMSGSLRVLPATTMPGLHDHVDLCLEDGQCLRFRDPRRFGMLQWTPRPAEAHPLLRDLGPEPLGPVFSGDYLYQRSRGRRAPIKTFIMDSHVVVGVGNIYANESLHLARIHPNRAAGRISRERLDRLAGAIRSVLADAIAQGGTSLRDFVQEDGNPGYFAQSLRVYGRTEQPCPSCGGPIRQCRIGQRSSFYCAVCQH
ncbi:bifunctional DNA-formamidopyrimidine glycosylase/DNA-(apurinic or apyrimidinic site) lyase [Lamprobacter modestohalophilus]|uniref:bifunctional DNA-formamidopyrimidine glycosylase/DNA-(apurinic or apyrimidinic site) lyase n=1 Tax=Lamprobacter modestohalophilus TaxID=1064514 RepID=UPI002ADED32B|nr:bifunctional DNA-formamidopyrimidine glycosylase/DNA-(apurinic or apyrimidinic site) lyase [Lamprobacter modestohalophilus]MEA1048292.1 bifunctional DNA-formamidopyrimidine glycosylase/DNA-(apurinic or apyrimidinic site) lyase [Lamprobacter modestohalophilus]